MLFIEHLAVSRFRIGRPAPHRTARPRIPGLCIRIRRRGKNFMNNPG
jgi:hypothetical protein